jgi:hypothetical protein
LSSCQDGRADRGLERDLGALGGASGIEGLRAALAELDGLWGQPDLAERARVLALMLDEVIVDAPSGEAELRLRGAAGDPSRTLR